MFVSKYSDVFTGLDCIKKQCHIYTDPKAKPVINPPRSILYMIHNQVKGEIDKMKEQGVIVKQHDPMPWINIITVVASKEKLKCVSTQLSSIKLF